ncbi:translocation/assembly module TamB domain-containing protein [Desulfoprunum benzoelyticum]|uniref:Translocation and assembly module TamB n=1 Tax=Desulfoprunum benzoelyticum TaxID=1506996 RepID=A0A840V3Q7_9BACT|nr:translocation/assembly module TamB domain-containing protein [Desulfoprunum benzoelyticum]MBB5348490.1 translocation and assembly module TamB [Desulfoprunum benzoelyticum]MBM9530175.1 translocation/assembly module TamB domain-containing protein [Desulfoprunum benzoelyticum]
MKKLLLPMLLLSLAAAIVVFAASPTGLRSLLRLASDLSQRSFAVGQVDGRLFSAWQLRDLELKLPGVDIVIAEVAGNWRPVDLVKAKLTVDRLTATGIVVTLRGGQAGEPAAETGPVGLPAVLLPFALDVDEVDITGLKVVLADGSTATDIHQLRLGLSADRERIEIRAGVIDAARYGLRLSGFIDAGAGWATDVIGAWRISPAGGYAEMAGTYSARGPFDRLQVSAAANRPADVRVSGVLEGLPANPHWQARAVGRQVWFPVFHDGWPRLMLDATVDAAGDFGRYHGTIKAGGSFLDFHGITATADVDGTGRGLSARVVKLRSPDGDIDIANLVLGWLDAFSWSGEATTRSFNPAGFDRRFEGVLTADLRSTGHLGYEDDDELRTDTEVHSVDGAMRGFPVSGKGRIRSAAARFEMENVFLQSGASFVQAAGTIAETYDLQFEFASPDIGEVLPDGEGELSVRGQVGGDRDFPALDLDLDAAAIRYCGQKIGRMIAKVHVDTRAGADMEATVDLEAIDWAGIVVDEGALHLDGTTEAHDLSASLHSAAGDLKFTIHGGLEDLEWEGRIEDTTLSGPDLGNWRQLVKADLQISRTGADLLGLCLARDPGRICLHAGWRSDEARGEWTVKGDVADLPLQFFSETGLTPWPLAGNVTAALTANGDGERVQSGEMTVAIPEIRIKSGLAEDGFENIVLHGNALELQLADGRLQGALQSHFQDNSSLELELTIADAGSLTASLLRQPVNGRLRLKLQDLGPIAPLTDFLLRPTGRIDSTLAIAGTLSRPVFEGRLDLHGGRVALPSLGIFLEEVGISLAAAGEEVEMEVNARSGPGEATAEGTLSYDDGSGLQGDFTVSGQQFQAVSLPEYEVLVNPDIRFTFTRDGGELSGVVTVPKAHIAPSEMKDTIAVSKDVVYTDLEKEEKVRHWPLVSRLDLRLGDDVRLDGYGLTGRLSGSLAIRNTSDTFVSGKGELTLNDGTFSLYGRSLAIRRGRMFFNDGPVDNPGIDARAVQFIREKSDFGGNLTIGVDVSGSLQELDFKLFSDPNMDEGDILAYMVVGHSMSDVKEGEGGVLQAAASTIGLEEGAGLVTTLTGLLPLDEMHLEGTEEDGDYSLVVGKKLTDRLYIGYDHNFFDQKGSFLANYNLGLGFSVVTRSSADSNAADIFYSIER